MNSNIFFSFSRFYLLLRNDILLNYKKYLFTIAGAFILGFILIYMRMPGHFYNDTYKFDASRYNEIFTMCLLGLAAFVGSAFSELSNKVKTSNYLLIPASTFEKFLCQFVIRAIVGTAIFLLIFWVDTHLARIAVLSNMKDVNNHLAGPEKYDYIEKFHFSMLLIKSTYPEITYWRLFNGIGMILTLFSAGMFLFSVKIFFRKLGLIKTGISLFAALYLIMILSIFFSHIFFPETVGFKATANTDYLLSNGYSNNDIFFYSIGYLAPLFLLPLGYFKLKEKQL
jgi:hypothetical protein